MTSGGPHHTASPDCSGGSNQDVPRFICKAVAREFVRVLAAELPNDQELLVAIDRLLAQATGFAREGLSTHILSARFHTNVIVAVDNDPQFDWLLPAVRKRLNDAAC